MIRTFIAFLCLICSATFALGQNNYTIKPGDTLQIEVLEDPSLNRAALVLPDGTFSFPLVGVIRAGGQTVGMVQDSIITGLRPQFASTPNVFVAVAALAPPPERAAPAAPTPPPTIDVFVTGQVNSPGKIEATPGTTILQVIAQAGGLTSFAAAKRIELRRADQVYLYDYQRSGRSGTIASSTVLAPGDVVIVQERGLFE